MKGGEVTGQVVERVIYVDIKVTQGAGQRSWGEGECEPDFRVLGMGQQGSLTNAKIRALRTRTCLVCALLLKNNTKTLRPL